ncbi:MAG: putative porin [Candidatus Manganitrophus sp. SA1]|nr:putative porin [Candidatus Manganitrophus morganii]
MYRWMAILLVAIGLVGLSSIESFAEERKTLEELLVDKGTISKEEAASLQTTKLTKGVDRMTFGGDLRLRHESFMNDSETASRNRDRHRQRFRLRFGGTLKIDEFLVGIQLASGGGEQVSTNQSFDSLFSQKPLWIQQAYLQWKAAQWLKLTGGKMPNPFFRAYSSDIVWDDDVTPEGFAESLTFPLSERVTLFVNAGQFVLDEDSGDNNDQWLFGEQVGADLGLGKSTKLTLAGAFYNFKNATLGTFGQAAVQEGNTRVPPTPPATAATNILVNNYRIVDITLQLAIKVGDLPLSLQGDYIKNLADTTTDKDMGYQAGVIVGKASDPQSWEAAYFYKLVETDATVADLADSDFGNGGTNRKGHIVWVAYNPTKALQLKAKFFMTELEDETLPPGAGGKDDIDRLQVDASIKF